MLREHIVDDLRKIGCSAEPFGDAYVVVGEHGKNSVIRVVETVGPESTPLTPWRGTVRIVRSSQEAVDLFIRRR